MGGTAQAAKKAAGGGGGAKGGFAIPYALSPDLAAVCGESELSRSQVVKKIWEYIKGNDLQVRAGGAGVGG